MAAVNNGYIFFFHIIYIHMYLPPNFSIVWAIVYFD